MQLPINVKSPNNISKWQMGFNSAFKGLMLQQILKKKDGTVYVGLIRLRIGVSGGLL
jgi:hypothetical protein